MKTKIVIRSAFDSPPEEAVNECIQTLGDDWKVVQANTTQQFYSLVGEPSTTRPHFVTTLVLEKHEGQSVAFSVDVLAESVWNNQWTIRTENILRNANINTIGDLTKLSEADMLKMPNCGKKSVKAIRVFLASHGVALLGETVPVTSERVCRSVNELPLRSTLLNVLYDAGIETVEQLSQHTVEQLQKYCRIGYKGIRDIEKALSLLGLRLRS